MLTRGYRPYPMSIVRVWLWSEFYFVVTLAVDKLTGFNYGFLLHKPEAFSILSFLSDSWPLYLLQMHGVALLFFLVLYAPFAVFDITKRGLIRKAGKQEATLNFLFLLSLDIHGQNKTIACWESVDWR